VRIVVLPQPDPLGVGKLRRAETHRPRRRRRIRRHGSLPVVCYTSRYVRGIPRAFRPGRTSTCDDAVAPGADALDPRDHRDHRDQVEQRSGGSAKRLRNTRREMPSCFRSVGCLSGNKLFDRGPDGFVCWCGSLVEAQQRGLMLDRGKRDQGIVGRTAEDLPGGYGGQKLQVAGF
jgi:hypothetical protein